LQIRRRENDFYGKRAESPDLRHSPIPKHRPAAEFLLPTDPK
jgi:hypothetical protein